MNDCESEVYTFLAEGLRDEFDSIHVSGSYQSVPPMMPHVSIIMTDNSVIKRSTTETNEHDAVTFEVNIYSNKSEGRKAEAKDIASVVDDLFRSKNFSRESMMPMQNAEDPSIYRIFARYTAETDGRYFYRR